MQECDVAAKIMSPRPHGTHTLLVEHRPKSVFGWGMIPNGVYHSSLIFLMNFPLLTRSNGQGPLALGTEH